MWHAAALLAPVVHGASGSAWLGVLAAVAAAWCLSRWTKRGRGWVLTVQSLWAAILAGVILGWTRAYWVELSFEVAVPLVLLGLILWTSAVPKKAERIGRVLLWPVALLLGSVLLSGLSEMKLEYWKPSWELPEPMLLALLMVPALQGKGTAMLGAAGLTVSLITGAVLSPWVAGSVSSGIYELSRSLSLLGVAERFESLVAAAMTLGIFSAAACLLDFGGKERRWGSAFLALLVAMAGLPVGGWILPIGAVVIWLILPNLAPKKISGKNLEKREKSS